MIVRTSIELTTDEINKLVNVAYSMGFKREDPRKSWTEKEFKEVVRFTVKRAIAKLID